MRASADTAELTVSRLSDAPGLADAADRLVTENMPAFMSWESPGNWRWHHLHGSFATHQLCVTDGRGTLVAAAHGLPVRWDGTADGLPAGADDVLVGAVDGDLTERPTALCLLSVSVASSHRGRGLPELLLRRARGDASGAGLRGLIIPVRPTDKARYPLVPMAEYIRWRTPDGRPFDPWLRTHLRLGAERLAVGERSLVIRQPVARWEQAAGFPMPGPGCYVVPGALAPVQADPDGSATYAEPNVWVFHPA